MLRLLPTRQRLVCFIAAEHTKQYREPAKPFLSPDVDEVKRPVAKLPSHSAMPPRGGEANNHASHRLSSRQANRRGRDGSS